MVEYPVTVPPYSSAILYSFEHRLASIYVKRFGKDTLTKQVELRLAFAPGRNPERRLIGTYTPGPGLRPL